jgi:ABC-type nitrate/sulfonate/bicarbonate transport system permease component
MVIDMIFISLVGFLINWSMQKLEKRVIKWKA